jgi:hypothetical protein
MWDVKRVNGKERRWGEEGKEKRVEMMMVSLGKKPFVEKKSPLASRFDFVY